MTSTVNFKSSTNNINLYSFDYNISNIEYDSNTTRFTTIYSKVSHVDEPIYLTAIKGTIMAVLILILVVRIFYDFENIVKIKKLLHQVLKRLKPNTNKSIFFKKTTSILPRTPSFTPSSSIPDIIQSVELVKKSSQDLNTVSSLAVSSNNNRPPPSYDEIVLKYQPIYVLQNLNQHIYFSKPYLPAAQPFQQSNSTYLNLE